jgi:hypothetical protein
MCHASYFNDIVVDRKNTPNIFNFDKNVYLFEICVAPCASSDTTNIPTPRLCLS